MMKVCIGGTFNVVHKGHKTLFEKAFEIAGKKGMVFIGVTTDKMAEQKRFMIPYEQRVNAIKTFLQSKGYQNRYSIIPIHDIFGVAADGDYDAIIVSPETEENAQAINKKRRKKGKKPLEIITVPYILAEDNTPIRATKILANDMDENGKIL